MKHILLIEDDYSISYVYKEKLEKNPDYHVEILKKEQDIQDKLMHEKFNLIIVDILFPHTDGLEMLRLIKRHINRSTPVIILSDSNRLVVEEELKEFEFEDFIQKDDDPTDDEIVEKVDTLISTQ
ncbi:hypothetical protein COV24_00120 [candidate division WWE3 bacterium CG10_big_fil_rev_8_21_14_0_10_32_10]|uniref:Response regulatory domain-containing protein n=1 Tax=candidate division WWE3 bacterium CG10_big_fil_rev_8_21_14_0_10_32_10 TaxID=1975090 RepID=A0A2H0RBL3_UNCKA|nr:MAG: hypothetical protein COV24_00120 [candidate division WWE3 bacterium CG10_big_fil_rev_8_21_14_0_10_32_10]